MTTLEDIRTSDWSQKLGEIGEIVTGIDDVRQCVLIIVTTPLGSDPLRPDFGCDVFGFLDRPVTTLRAHVVRSITDAVARWEPRAIIESVRLTSVGADGSVEIEIEMSLDVAATADSVGVFSVIVTLRGS